MQKPRTDYYEYEILHEPQKVAVELFGRFGTVTELFGYRIFEKGNSGTTIAVVNDATHARLICEGLNGRCSTV